MSAIRTAKPMNATMSEMLRSARFAATMARDAEAAARYSRASNTTGPMMITGSPRSSAALMQSRRTLRNVPPGESQYSALAVEYRMTSADRSIAG